jgi:hypothetical protein
MSAPGISDLLAAVVALFSPTPELRRVPEKEQGPHRSATPESTHMQAIPINSAAQGPLSFIREGFVTFTPAQAALVLRECRYERQRDEMRAKPHIAVLAEQMRRGLWLPRTQIDFAIIAGRVVLVNGHHRMRAQIDAGAEIIWNVVIHPCSTDEELRSLYWRFDTHLRKRTASNILSGIGFAQEAGLQKEVAKALWQAAPVVAAGMRFARYQQDQRDMLPDERLAFCREHLDGAHFMQEAFAKAIPPVRRKLLAVSQFAVAMATLKHSRSKAEGFWTGVCEDDGLPKGDPRKALLLDMQVRGSKGALLAAQMMAAARCWNAWHGGRQIGHVKVTGNAIPLAGTPYTVQA